MRHARLLTAVLALVAGAVGVKAGHAMYIERQQCAAIHDRAASLGDLEKGSGPAGVVALGDSYAAGIRLPDVSRSWARLAASQVSGIGGTGYVNGGPCHDQTFENRADLVLAAMPKVVLIEGGLNDVSTDPAEVEAAAERTLQRFRDVPTVVVIGPPDVPTREGEDRIDEALCRAAASAGRRYVSLLHEPIQLGPDGLHPTPAGQAHIAAIVTD